MKGSRFLKCNCNLQESCCPGTYTELKWKRSSQRNGLRLDIDVKNGGSELRSEKRKEKEAAAVYCDAHSKFLKDVS